MAPGQLKTVGETLFWSYANLAMAHAAVTDAQVAYGKTSYMIRARLYKGLTDGTMSIGSFLEDERVKIFSGAVCSYCGSTTGISMDHIVPKCMAGLDRPENVIGACRTCNSSKAGRDLLVWMEEKNRFPSLMVLRRYIKMAHGYCEEHGLMDMLLKEVREVECPFRIDLLPTKFPNPSGLFLVVTPVSDA